MGRIKGSTQKKKPLKDRLYAKVKVNDKNGCWEMKPYKGHRYPNLQVNNMSIRANRLSWEIYNNKKIPSGYCCLHLCDNTTCINPKHLIIGTHKENMQDMIKKGRDKKDGPKGERCAQHKLKKEQVIEIKKMLKGKKVNMSEIARKYNVNNVTIFNIRHGHTWKNIGE